MSYVVQNFHHSISSLPLSRKFRFFLYSQNVYKIFYFFKLKFFFLRFPFSLTPFAHRWFTAFEEYYMFNIFSIKKKFSTNARLTFKRKFDKTIFFYSLTVLNNLFCKKPTSLIYFSFSNSVINNAYFYPVRTVFFRSRRKLFKLFFRWLVISWLFLWTPCASQLKFSQLYFFFFYPLELYYFNNKRFFKVLNL